MYLNDLNWFNSPTIFLRSPWSTFLSSRTTSRTQLRHTCNSNTSEYFGSTKIAPPRPSKVPPLLHQAICKAAQPDSIPQRAMQPSYNKGSVCIFKLFFVVTKNCANFHCSNSISVSIVHLHIHFYLCTKCTCSVTNTPRRKLHLTFTLFYCNFFSFFIICKFLKQV